MASSSDFDLEDRFTVEPFLVASRSAEKYILYAIAFDLELKHSERIQANCRCLIDDDDKRFIEVERLKITLHDGPYRVISYQIKFGRGYIIPKIKNNKRER